MSRTPDETIIHVEGRWTFPRNGNAGSAGQFKTEQDALEFCIRESFDTADLVDTVSGRKAYLGEQEFTGRTGWVFEDGEFIGLPE